MLSYLQHIVSVLTVCVCVCYLQGRYFFFTYLEIWGSANLEHCLTSVIIVVKRKLFTLTKILPNSTLTHTHTHNHTHTHTDTHTQSYTPHAHTHTHHTQTHTSW